MAWNSPCGDRRRKQEIRAARGPGGVCPRGRVPSAHRVFPLVFFQERQGQLRFRALAGLYRVLEFPIAAQIVPLPLEADRRQRRFLVSQSTPGTPLVLLRRTVSDRIISTQVPST